MKKSLITGAHGFLGRYTARRFSTAGYRVVGIGHGNWGFENPSNFGIDKWVETDIDFSALADLNEKFDCIVHCAGGSSVLYSCLYPLKDFRKTVNGTAEVLEYMRLHQQNAKLIYPSSAAVYGMKKNFPIKVGDSLDPLSPYGFHKKMAEDLCASYATSFNISVAIVRFFSIYGAGLHKQLLWDACHKLAESEKSIEFFGTGEETRDWLHIDDAVSLLYFMAESNNSYDLVNGGYGQALTIREITTKLTTLYGKNIQVNFNKQYKEGDPKHYWSDISGAIQTGWEPKICIDQGLQEYVRWFQNYIKK